MPHAWDGATPLEETLEALAAAVKAGQVRALGCSNFSGAQWRQACGLAEAKSWPRFEFDQVEYSLAARAADGDVLPAAAALGASILAWSPLAGGFLTGKYSGAARPPGRRKDPARAFPPLDEARFSGVTKVLSRVAARAAAAPAAAALAWVLSRPGVAAAVVGARSVRQLKEDLALKSLSAQEIGFLDQASALCSRYGSKGPDAPGPSGPKQGASRP